MSIYLRQAKRILAQINIDAPEVKQAKDELRKLTKTAGLGDIIHDPKFQNVVTLLTPFVVNYKVNQVLKLLKELARDTDVISTVPGTRFKKYL